MGLSAGTCLGAHVSEATSTRIERREPIFQSISVDQCRFGVAERVLIGAKRRGQPERTRFRGCQYQDQLAGADPMKHYSGSAISGVKRRDLPWGARFRGRQYQDQLARVDPMKHYPGSVLPCSSQGGTDLG
ncbi:hypothetical protein [Levilactobacillus paucivorans]|uniref:hypothetical protein n=1 Tax=Levilactobacillus paucivorans TaxID=616990 RepID=UPI0012EDB671|nr:hypothetical protein [Levilactobacillus paucivorans]